MDLGSRCADIMSCHGYGPVDTGLQGFLKPKEVSKKGNHDPPMLGGLDRLNELQKPWNLFPQAHVLPLGKMGWIGKMEKFPQLV